MLFLVMFKDLDLIYENGRVEIIEKFGSDVFLSLMWKNLIVNFKVEVKDFIVVFLILKGKGLSIIFKVILL